MIDGPDARCPNCRRPFDGDEAACAHCGQLRAKAPAAQSSPAPAGGARPVAASEFTPLAGCLGSIPASIGLFFVYGLLMLAFQSAVSQLWWGPLENVQRTKIGTVANLSLTTLLVIGALLLAVRLAKRGRVGFAILLMLTAFFGLVPAAMCSSIFGAL